MLLATQLIGFGAASDGQVYLTDGGLFTDPFDFTAVAWANSSVTVTADNVSAPNGTSTADKLESTGGDGYLRQTVNGLTASDTYTMSVWLRGDSSFSMNIYSLTPVTPTVCSVTTSWQRFTLTLAISGTNTEWQIGGGSTFTTGEIVYAWGARLEAGSTATP
jgi:hypothetical protein